MTKRSSSRPTDQLTGGRSKDIPDQKSDTFKEPWFRKLVNLSNIEAFPPGERSRSAFSHQPGIDTDRWIYRLHLLPQNTCIHTYICLWTFSWNLVFLQFIYIDVCIFLCKLRLTNRFILSSSRQKVPMTQTVYSLGDRPDTADVVYYFNASQSISWQPWTHESYFADNRPVKDVKTC